MINNNQDLLKLINKALERNEPITIETNKGKAIVISEEKYNSMIETIYLVSQPGLLEKIKKGEKEDIDSMTTYDPNEEW